MARCNGGFVCIFYSDPKLSRLLNVHDNGLGHKYFFGPACAHLLHEILGECGFVNIYSSEKFDFLQLTTQNSTG
jgi:hypothetical protein